MDFASDFLYVGDAEEEVFDVEALSEAKKSKPKPKMAARRNARRTSSDSDEDEGLQLSDEENDVTSIPQERLRKVRKADTNLCAVNLGSLADEAIVHFTGDPVLCKSCSAAMTEISKIDTVGGGQKWVCEYCEETNEIHLEDEEIPKANSIDYLVIPPAEKKDETDDILIFCIDVSGSMCCTSELKGDIKIKQNASLQQSLSQFIDANGVGGRAEQFLPNEDRSVTYVSRLQCVQAAVMAQLEALAKTFPKKRVGIVTFSNEVTVHLPGASTHTITGDHLYDYDYLIGAVEKLQMKLDIPIERTEKELVKIIMGLQESGATALGPALLASIGIAGQSKGSHIVLCTDGVANVGLGSLEDYSAETASNHPATNFYEKAGEAATRAGVAVSVISIKGTNTSLELIAKIALQTKGVNDIVDPLKLTKNFNFVLQNNIVATEVSTKMFLQKGLKFKHEDNTVGNTCTRVVGNVTKESAITFEYLIEDTSKLANAKAIPFQIQIEYTKLNGARCLRVLSKVANVTDKREQAEARVNVGVVGLHTQVQTAKLASEGNYTKARMLQKANMRMVQRGLKSGEASEVQKTQYSVWNTDAVRLNKAIKTAKTTEEGEGLDYNSASDDHSDCEDNFSFFGRSEAKEAPKEAEKQTKEKETKEKVDKKKKKTERKEERQYRRTQNDALSNVLYQAQNPSYAKYNAVLPLDIDDADD